MTSSIEPAASGHGDRPGYYLPRDIDETLRLNAQHHALVHRSGWLLHPKIQKSISEIKEPHIADVACGSGVWALELAEKFPTTIVTGLDISAKQFPPKWSWPSNARLDILDLCGEVPAKYCGRFDVVHCRFLLIAGPTVDPKIFVDTFAKLLKPGGWLQWQEMPYPPGSAFEPVRDEAGLITGYQEVPVRFDTIAKVGNFEYKCMPVMNFAGWFKENSVFENIEQVDMPPTPSDARLEYTVMCSAMHGGATQMLQIKGLDDATKEGLKEDGLTGQRFLANGTLCAYHFRVCLGQAPGTQ